MKNGNLIKLKFKTAFLRPGFPVGNSALAKSPISVVAMSTNISGPYRNQAEVVPWDRGGDYFQDKSGHWWCACFVNDSQSPFHEKPAIVKVDFTAAGKIVVAKQQPDSVTQK